MEPQYETRQARKRRKFRPGGKLFLLLILLLLGTGIYFFIQYQQGQDIAGETEIEPEPFEGDENNSGYQNILVLGVDSRGEAQSRTDTMMMVTHDRENNEVKITSFMRDIYADIPGYQSYKLNTAYYLGGVDLLASTLRDMFGVEIHNYALVDFQSFETLVDIAAPNGVEIDVEKEMSEKIGVSLSAGVQELNGQELLGYARFRSDNEGDFGRVRRQQQVIAALKDELISVSSIPKLPKLAGAAQAYVQTDMPLVDQIKLATQLGTGGSGEIERLTIPVEGGYSYANYPQAGSVLEIDIEQNRRALEQFLSQPLN
ncbi:LCP family protein [Planococcus maritimus]|uniref:Regulatory protein MsrR n=1 Tax=Planococcus maritimus TaxID=192421 RepID=A0A7D7RK06_PLAMR|nr:LCP family protein [Planococcus maritimus]KYG58780.1 transcriptional regulator [Planococcus maritimus]OED32480.1 transcriptional regulator [Planococcus maritimus]QMT16084.1 LCP family protein [Planococcus maritimus]